MHVYHSYDQFFFLLSLFCSGLAVSSAVEVNQYSWGKSRKSRLSGMTYNELIGKLNSVHSLTQSLTSRSMKKILPLSWRNSTFKNSLTLIVTFSAVLLLYIHYKISLVTGVIFFISYVLSEPSS